MAGLRNEYSTFPHFGGYVKECPCVQEMLAHIFRVMGHQVQHYLDYSSRSPTVQEGEVEFVHTILATLL